jgi:hypothetical protein
MALTTQGTKWITSVLGGVFEQKECQVILLTDPDEPPGWFKRLLIRLKLIKPPPPPRTIEDNAGYLWQLTDIMGPYYKDKIMSFPLTKNTPVITGCVIVEKETLIPIATFSLSYPRAGKAGQIATLSDLNITLT